MRKLIFTFATQVWWVHWSNRRFKKSIRFFPNINDDDVVKDLKDKLPNFKFLLVGDGPDYELYQKTIKKYGIEDKVIMTGKVPWEKVPYYYHLSDIFLTASHTETQGLTIIEAMASGSVPVCINDESFQNARTENRCGYCFTPYIRLA